MGDLTSKAPRRYGGIAPEARQQERRDKLIQAGIELFGSRGYHAVTVREICAAAKLTERYYYESFTSPEKLFAAVYGHVALELKQATLAALGQAQRHPLALAEAALRVFFEYVRNDPRRARILLIDAVTIGTDIGRLADQAMRDYTDLMRGFIDVLFPDAAAAGLKPELLSAGLIGANIRIATQWVQEDFRQPLEIVLENTMAFYEAMNSRWGFDRTPRPAARKAPATRRASRKAPPEPQRR
jgi:AcrR family transcriptional regulator